MLVTVILEPYFHLSGCEADHISEMLSLGRGEILLLLEPSLQFIDLRLREEDPPLASVADGEGAVHGLGGIIGPGGPSQHAHGAGEASCTRHEARHCNSNNATSVTLHE